MTEMEKLNRFTRRPFTEEEVYRFDVVLCDNDIDRDLERFSDEALGQMQGLFVGKTGIFDHDLRSGGQTTRIYDTEVVREDGRRTRDGRPYVSLKAKAYMVRTEDNQALIREIEGGIKKEVSVSCAAGRHVCSVCGADRRETACGHVPGRSYGDTVCCTVLDDIRDAYEWSFVAVPAQVQAGVTKHCSAKEDTMDGTKGQEALLAEVEQMLREDVLAMCGREGAVSKALVMAAGRMGLEELMAFRKALRDERAGVPEVQLADVDTAQTDFRMPGA